jgi:hypothetical protein
MENGGAGPDLLSLERIVKKGGNPGDGL